MAVINNPSIRTPEVVIDHIALFIGGQGKENPLFIPQDTESRLHRNLAAANKKGSLRHTIAHRIIIIGIEVRRMFNSLLQLHDAIFRMALPCAGGESCHQGR